MNGAVGASGAYLTSGNAWVVKTIGDFNGDGKADVVIQNSDGSSYMLLMNGTAVASGAYLTTAGSGWTVRP